MPVIIIGADTSTGRQISEALADPDREIRAFVTDEDIGIDLKRGGLKVAIGDVSDESHVEAASMRCFSAVLIAEAAFDGRERSFANSSSEVLEAWARAVAESGVQRAIWVIDGDAPITDTPEMGSVHPDDPEVVTKVVELDEAQTIS